jgi:hypothetical protein
MKNVSKQIYFIALLAIMGLTLTVPVYSAGKVENARRAIGAIQEMVGGGGNSGRRGVTITGIPSKYNGKYVYVQGKVGERALLGLNYALEDLPKISGGRVTVPMSTTVVEGDRFIPYTGSDTVEVTVAITGGSNAFSFASSMVAGGTIKNARFTNGSFSATFADFNMNENIW